MTTTIKKYKSPLCIVVSGSLVILGLCMMLYSASQGVIMGGAFISLFGVVAYFAIRPNYCYIPLNLNMHRSELYFPGEKLENVMTIFRDKEFEQISKLPQNGQGLRMEVFNAKKDDLVLVQVFHYVPYEYKEVGPTFEFKGKDAERLKAQLAGVA